MLIVALTPTTLVEFLKDAQPDEWARLTTIYGTEVETKVVENIARNLNQRGMLECLRHGVTDRGVKPRLAYFKPATRMNAETLALYEQNILAVTRQVHYSEKYPNLSIDVLLSLNGLPIAMAELKNQLSPCLLNSTSRRMARLVKGDDSETITGARFCRVFDLRHSIRPSKSSTNGYYWGYSKIQRSPRLSRRHNSLSICLVSFDAI